MNAIIPTARFSSAVLFASALIGTAAAQTVDLDVPFVPTPPQVVDKMMEVAGVKNGDVVIDLGSGDGRIAIAAAKKGARAYGVDINPVRIEEANANARQAGVADRATFSEQNLFDTNIKDADVITMYLLPSVNRDLRSRILDLEPGTRIVSHAFDMGEWEADQRINVDGREVYFWRVPAKTQGRWTFQHNGQSIPVSLTQRFQKVEGTASLNGGSAEVKGTVDGEILRLALDTPEGLREFHGRVNGTTLEPVAAEGTATGWTARRG
jgi:SAM-dependent methyltransferase